MASIVQKLTNRKLISPPNFLPSNIHLECIAGSEVYGVSTDKSDKDIVGFCIPPKEYIFPHLNGFIKGFGTSPPEFNGWQEHHIEDRSAKLNYDINIHSIVRFFHLCYENNPNMLDVLFTPKECILYSTNLGQLVIDKRHIFLHKGLWVKFRGYALSQLHKMDIKNRVSGSKRAKDIEQYGFDTKYSYHLVRLLQECQQLLATGDLDLRQGNEYLKAIRRGDITEIEIREWTASKDKYLEELYQKTTLPEKPDEAAIKELLLNCLEHHYGDLSRAVVTPDSSRLALQEILQIAERGLR